MGKLFSFFKSEREMEIIKAGWRYSGITSATKNIRNGDLELLNIDPYKEVEIA